jgi:hypothetical protein
MKRRIDRSTIGAERMWQPDSPLAEEFIGLEELGESPEWQPGSISEKPERLLLGCSETNHCEQPGFGVAIRSIQSLTVTKNL